MTAHSVGPTMSDFDLVIANGTVATASDTFKADVGIRDGRIVALAAGLTGGSQTIDATDGLVLPGGIDSHVHVSQRSGPGIVMADDFESATGSAAFGGNTLVMPFGLQQKGESLRQAVKDYHAKANGKCYVDVSFHLIISDPLPSVLGQELPALVDDGYTSFKVFMTYQDLALTDIELLEVFSTARETGALVMVHAENYDAIRFLTDRLERGAKRDVPDLFIGPLPVQVRRSRRQACAEGTHKLPLGAERHTRGGDAFAHPVFRRGRETPDYAQPLRRRHGDQSRQDVRASSAQRDDRDRV